MGSHSEVGLPAMVSAEEQIKASVNSPLSSTLISVSGLNIIHEIINYVRKLLSYE